MADEQSGRSWLAWFGLENPRVRRAVATTRAVVFGDRAGETLFLGALVFLALTWRVGTFFNDIALFVPALERLAAGHVSLGTPSQVEQFYPGMHYRDGYVYARNYGQLALSLPAYWLVSALGATAVRALVVLGWSGSVVVIADRAGARLDRRRQARLVGGAVGLVALASNALVFGGFHRAKMPLTDALAAVIALQLTTMVAAAMTGVFLYRVLARRHGRRLGLLAGAVTVVASPVGFWATLPKRHAFSAFFVALALYALARSRDVDRDGPLGQAGFRGIAYASAGLLAWVHSPEGFTLFLALALVDVPTAPRNDLRSLGIVAAALALSLVPFFATNYVVAGNPLEPPRFLRVARDLGSLPGPDQIQGGGDGAGGGAGSGGSGAVDGGSGGSSGEPSSGGGDPGPVSDGGGSSGPALGIDLEALVPAEFVSLLQIGILQYVAGLQIAADQTDRLVTVFVRWGEASSDPGHIRIDQGTDLSVLESVPLGGALLAAPVAFGARVLRQRSDPRTWDVDATDSFVLVAAVLFVTLALPSLPVHTMFTVRYLHPLYPLLVYGIFRQRAVRNALTNHTDYGLWGFEAAALFGTPIAFGAVLLDDSFFPPPEGVLVNWVGLVALGAAAAVAASCLASAVDDRAERVTALSLGVAAGVTTTYLVFAALYVFHFGESMLPIVQTIAQEYANAVFP